MSPARATAETTSGADEAVLLGRARDGDLSAFEEIVRRYQRRVYGVARRIVRRHEVADDVAQETYLRAWQSLSRFDVAKPFGPWVCRIAVNLAINQVRSPAWREDPLAEGQAEEPAPSASPLGEVLDGEAGMALDRALASLPPDQRAVFVLRAVEELSYREIAAALGVQIGTVMSRLHRARARLADALGPWLSAAPRAGGV
jgi:RNA polymerase sigma-70 factor (ECF subfamily)